MLCYREMRKEDLARWEELAKSEFLEEDFCSASYLRNKWRKIKGWILMTPDKEWIGCCFVDSYLHRYNPEGIHFLEYCTFPKFRGQGYAKYLVKLQFDYAAGVKKSACINSGNDASIAVLTKYGFRAVAPRKSWTVYLCDADYYPSELKDLELEQVS